MQIKLLEPDLRLLIESVATHIAEVHNEIVTCPDAARFAVDLQKLQLKRTRLEYLKTKLKIQLP